MPNCDTNSVKSITIYLIRLGIKCFDKVFVGDIKDIYQVINLMAKIHLMITIKLQ